MKQLLRIVIALTALFAGPAASMAQDYAIQEPFSAPHVSLPSRHSTSPRVERARGTEKARVARHGSIGSLGEPSRTWEVDWCVRKWHSDADRLAGKQPYEVKHIPHNKLTTAGITRMLNLLTNQGATQAADATHTRIGVGDTTNSGGTEAVGDTDLAAAAGSTHRWFQVVTGAGTVSTNTLAFSATFASGDGNFAWNEFGIDVGSTTSGNTVASLLFNHKVLGTGSSLGTKSGGSWTITVTLTIT